LFKGIGLAATPGWGALGFEPETSAGSETGLIETGTGTGPKDHGFATVAIHAGNTSDCSAFPIHLGATNHNGEYTRDQNPSTDALARLVQQLDGAEAALATACGMAAISQTLFSRMGTGD